MFFVLGAVFLGLLVAEFVYFALTDGGSMQGSFGKRIVGIMVCTADGMRVPRGRAWGRSAIKTLCRFPYLGLIPTVISMITIGAPDQKRSLHDMAARTLVVRRRMTYPYQ